MKVTRGICAIQKDISLFEGVVCWAWILFIDTHDNYSVTQQTFVFKDLDINYDRFINHKDLVTQWFQNVLLKESILGWGEFNYYDI